MAIRPHTRRFHATTNVSENPLFRALWLYVCRHRVSHHRGDGCCHVRHRCGIYTTHNRVPASLAACSALCNCLFALSAAHSFLRQCEPPQSRSPGQSMDSQSDDDSFIQWCVFTLGCVHHTTWTASHTYTTHTTYTTRATYTS